jgi:large repetitive protein
VTGIAVFVGCKAVTAGAGSLACAAASGAAANAVSYAISAAQSGSFSWSALGETTAEGAVEGLAGGDAGQAAEDARPSCGGQSFTAATGVLLASGKTIPISRLKAGDKVKAVNTKSGKAEGRDRHPFQLPPLRASQGRPGRAPSASPQSRS